MTITKKNQLVCVVLALLLLTTALLMFAPIGIADAAVIKRGASGSQVRTLQTKLKNWGYYSGSVDGVFGANTEKAVKSFQKKNGLTQDGIVGNATARALGITLSGGTSSSTGGSGATNSDLYLLSRCIYGEARGEPYTGKVAIAAVVLNRVKSSKFPNTVSGVIYQNGAFTCVSDGQINLGTNDECTRAAQDAINGYDPTYGCLFYYNPVTATNQWIRQKKIVLTIGKHVFCL
ncbi:MAG: spore cortex-lytic enzyme [Clostridia bacterium]